MNKPILLALAYATLSVYGLARGFRWVGSWAIDLAEDIIDLAWCAFNVRPFRTPVRALALGWLLWSIATIDS